MRAMIIVAFGVLALFTNSGVVANRSPRNFRRVAAAGEENDVRMKALIRNTSISTTFGLEEERGIMGGLIEKLSRYFKAVYLKLFVKLQVARTDQDKAIKGLLKKKFSPKKLYEYHLDVFKNRYLNDGSASPEYSLYLFFYAKMKQP
uniref:RxLR effector candidate protein n=1 Tax=Hyaloperonospora arabidopsidis (strain Emoy2) TaxID=559515 RepID=A0A090BBJ5_HYAAE|nr:RxLR effector candidate protein [Hyaloperonospora arabidopsidis Emoy2]